MVIYALSVAEAVHQQAVLFIVGGSLLSLYLFTLFWWGGF